ncbi:MAG: RDD family protein, partial [Gemmobacter sp.]
MPPFAAAPSPGLPDPEVSPGFYDGVPVKRLVAWAVDSALILLLTLIAVPFTAFTALFFFPVLWLAIGFAYRIVTLATASATPGMRLVAIELRDRMGRPFDLAHAIGHTLGYTLSISTVLVQVASIVLMLTGARGQGLTDLLLGTAAINRPA